MLWPPYEVHEHAEPRVIVDAGDDLSLAAVDEEHPAHHIHPPLLHRRVALPPLRVPPALAARFDQPAAHAVDLGTTVATTAAPALVAEAPADGYTLLVNTSAHAYSAALVDDLPYDPLHDFVPVAPLTSQAYVLVASAAAAIGSLRELIAAARASPANLSSPPPD